MRSQTKVRLRWNALAGAWTIQKSSLVVAQWSAPPCPESSGPRPVGKVVFASQLNGEDASGPRPVGKVSVSQTRGVLEAGRWRVEGVLARAL